MGARGRPCSVCVGDVAVLQQINGLIAAGEMPTAVARLTGIPKDRIVRHRKHTLGLTPPTDPDTPDEMTMSDERLNRWLRRSEELYKASLAQADLKSAIQAVQHGVRSEIEWRRRKEVRAEQAATDADPTDPKNGAPSIAWLDQIVNKSRAAQAAAAAEALKRGEIPCPICSFGRVHPKTIAERLSLLRTENNEHSRNPN